MYTNYNYMWIACGMCQTICGWLALIHQLKLSCHDRALTRTASQVDKVPIVFGF